ncbi:MAG: FlgD immunoglobulin-like domain containing protein [bacterium]
MRTLRGLRGALVPAGFLAATLLHEAQAATIQGVQSGTATSSANGVVTVPIAAVNPAKSFLMFGTRHADNRPPASMVRGRIASATTLEFGRTTSATDTTTIAVRWYVVEYAAGVSVQRGAIGQVAATTNVTLPTPVAALDQAFVTWSKTPASSNTDFNALQPILAELTSTTNLQIRAGSGAPGHTIWWQVIEFTDPDDIEVRKGSITTMGTSISSVTATLSPPMDPSRTFVLVGYTTTIGGPDIGKRMLRAVLTDSATVTIDRNVTGNAISDIVWQAVELSDGSFVQGGSENIASGTAQKTIGITSVNSSRAVPFASVQAVAGQSLGRSPYITDDVLGVGSVTMAMTSSTQVSMQRTSTADQTDIGWFVVEFGALDADVDVVKTVDDGSPAEGGSVTYTVTVTNNGPDGATGVAITDLLPAGVTYVSDTPSQGTYTSGTGVWDVGLIEDGGSATLQITATVDAGTAGTTIGNTATVTALDQTDSVPGNDSDSADIAVEGVDVEVAKSADDPTPDEGGTVTYTVVVTNHGPDVATGVEVTDLLPAGVVYQSHTTTQGTYVPGTGLWTVGAVTTATSDTLSIIVTVDGNAGGTTIENTASLGAVDQVDTDAGNDSDSVEIAVQETGPDEQQITFDPGADQRPNWSASDATIAFDSDRSGNLDLWTVPSGGGTEVQLTTDILRDQHPDHSSDGAQIVFSSRVGGEALPGIWLMPAGGGTPTLLTEEPTSDDRFPTFSPDGSMVAFTRHEDVWVIPSTGGTPVQLTSDPNQDLHPSWSPDGTMIAFQSNRSGNNDIWVVPAAGGAATQITTHPASDAAPDWAPSDRILIQSNRAGSSDIWTIPAGAGTAVQITSGSGNDLQPDWSRDGTKVAFTRDGDVWTYRFPTDLEVAKSVDDPTPAEGDTIQYAIDVTNHGPKGATGVAVTDLLPAGVAYQSHSTTQGTYDDGSGVWTIGSVPFGATETLTITATIDAGTSGTTIVNTAAVSVTDQSDHDAANDSASVGVAVEAVLSISSAADQTFVVGAAPAAISPIRITDDGTVPAIAAANDLRVRIPAGFPMEWDTTDLAATIVGVAAGKVSATVSYEDAGKTLVIDVTSDFAAADQITISDLSFENFSGTSSSDNLELEIGNDGALSALDDKTIEIILSTSSELVAGAPTAFRLEPARPNPSSGDATIQFDVPVEGPARLEIFDVSGRRVATLVDGRLVPGRYSPTWDGRDATGRRVAAGVYFVRLEAPAFRGAKKMVRLR